MWEDLRSRSNAKGEFQGVKAYAELKDSKHVVEIELLSEKFHSTAGMDYKALEWSRALNMPRSASDPCICFAEIRPPVQQRVSERSSCLRL